VRLPLTIPLFRSRRLIGLLALVHLAALAALWPLQLSPPVAGALAAAVAASAGLSLRRAWFCRVIALHLGARGELEIEAKVGARETAIVLPQTTVLPGLVVMLLRVGGRSERLVLPTDATGVAAHRQLRLWLRWRSSAGS
jgi:hypothetical protein